MRARRVGSVVGLVVAALAAVAAPAASAPEPVSVVATGLTSPFGLQFDGTSLFVAETFAGQVTRVRPGSGATAPVVTGLPGPAAAARVGNKLVVVTAAADDPSVPTTGDASVLVAEPGQPPRVLADLEAYELANNPDGQLQFDPVTNAQIDALSNPFDIVEQRGSGYVLVADAGANAVLSVGRTGKVSTFFVPPLVTTGDCAGAENNDPEHVGCDSVPTGLAYGRDRTLYVSTLSSDAPGEGRVYVLGARRAEVLEVISGLTGPTGVAVGPDGAVYVSEVFGDSPAGPPGRIVRIAPDGTRTYAAVPLPIGLDFHGGVLYTTSFALAGPGEGQILALRPSAFA